MIGAMALATMFSTCLELAEYVTLGKEYPTDHTGACTRMDLLKARLWTWGRNLNIQEPDCESWALREGWAAEKEVVARSLSRIKDILQRAGSLTEKCKPGPETFSIPSRPLIDNDFPHSSDSVHRTDDRVVSRNSVALLWRRTAWALHYKRKLDTVLVELEFLIHNLEQVVARLGLCSMSTQEAGGGGGAARRNENVTHTATYSYGNAKHGKFLTGPNVDAKRTDNNNNHGHSTTTTTSADHRYDDTSQSLWFNTEHDQDSRDKFFYGGKAAPQATPDAHVGKLRSAGR